jgi:predicted HicB family RNase H-like nuclease
LINAMNYKGYLARVGFDSRDNIFVGHVLGLSEHVSFHGETVPELTEDFHHAIDHYLNDCVRIGCDANISHLQR